MTQLFTADTVWRLHRGEGPLVATALHDGHDVRDDVAQYLALSEAERLREEDPFTAAWTDVAPTRIIGTRSRFEVDLNRPREKAVYRKPEDAWGLMVWREDTPEAVFERSLAEYDQFYHSMRALLDGLVRDYGRFVVLDLHSYNHRRFGTGGPPGDREGHPQVNVGTGTMDRSRWATVVDAFIESLRAFDFPGGRLDVRENIKFFGGYWPRWIHKTFPESGVAIAIEVKKFFMDEWTGEPDPPLLAAVTEALRSTVPVVLNALHCC